MFRRASLPFMALAALFAVVSARAQIEVSIQLSTTEAMQYEPVGILARVVNNTGADLDLSGLVPGSALRFDVESQPGVLAKPLQDRLFTRPLVVPARKTITQELNLQELYDIRDAVPYTITARIEWEGKVFISNRKSLEVTPGLEIDRLVAGIPGRSDQIRIFSLRTLRREGNDHLFLRIDDEQSGICYGVYDIGRIVRLFKPVLKQDAEGGIHILHQSGPWRYTLSVFSADGKPLRHQFFSSEVNTVTLEENERGQVDVKGGSAYEGSPERPPPDRNVTAIPEELDLLEPVKAK